jgi:hypothetical protein
MDQKSGLRFDRIADQPVVKVLEQMNQRARGNCGHDNNMTICFFHVGYKCHVLNKQLV